MAKRVLKDKTFVTQDLSLLTVDEMGRLIAQFKEAGVTEFELEAGGMRMRVAMGQERSTTYVPVSAMHPQHALIPHVASSTAPPMYETPQPRPAGEPVAPPAPPVEEKPGKIIVSPMVGTFYRSPAPEAPPYVEVGSNVGENSVLCIVEAMKIMNEIKAECRGTIAEIMIENGQPVEYGQPIFRVVP